MIALEPPQGLLPADAVSTEAEAWRALGLSRGGLQRFVRTAQKAVGIEGEVEVLLAGDLTLQRLNRQYRGKNKATDVLSFPGAPELAAVHAGDLAISLETAGRQAAEYGHTLRDEVRVLLLHGLLHLHGMDHEADRGEMAAREGELRRSLRLPNGLIARVEAGENQAEVVRRRTPKLRHGRQGEGVAPKQRVKGKAGRGEGKRR